LARLGQFFFGGCRTEPRIKPAIGTQLLRRKSASAIKALILGGLISLPLIISGCATVTTISDGPPPRPETIEALIYDWDKIEKVSGPAPSAYRDQYVSALKALSASLAETDRWRARAESK
jgi:hypothetical protein